MQSVTQLSIHSFIQPPIYLLNYTFTCPFIHPSIHVCLSIHLLNCSSFSPPTIQTSALHIIWQPIQPLIYQIIHPFICPPLIHLVILDPGARHEAFATSLKTLPAHIPWPVIVPTSLAYTLGHISQHFPTFLGGYLDMDSFISCDIHSFLSPSNMPGTWLIFSHLIFTKAPWGKY